jgi:AcrR family transcriptional regulator
VTSTTSRRGPYAKTAGRIDGILDAALELFAVNGYRATTMKEIADRTGMSQAGLMHHFPAKADILIALLQRRDERSSALTPEASALPLLDRLLTAADDIRDQPALVALQCVLSAEATAPDHPAHAYFKDRNVRNVSRTSAAFAELQRQGGIRPDADPASLARMTLALLDGLQMQWLYDPSSVDIRADLQAFISVWIT